MDVASASLVSLGLLAAAAAWMWWHVRVWRQTQRHPPEAQEYDFRRRQFLRRMQTSGLLAALAVAIFVGVWLTGPPLLVTLFWLGVLLLAGWLMLLALADMLASRMHFTRLRDEYLVEQTRLREELKRLQAREGNGEKSPGSKKPR